MRRSLAVALGLMAACAGLPAAIAQTPPAPAKAADLLTVSTDGKLACLASATQGGAILCKAPPAAEIALADKLIAKADAEGVAVIGLSRAQKSPAKISLVTSPAADSSPQHEPTSVNVAVLPRHDDVGSMEMECAKIAPQTPEDKKKAEESWVKKDKALKIFSDPLAPLALAKPVEATDKQYSISSFGRTRTYVPKTKDCKGTTNVHNGTDIAVITGTDIRAPMAGTVILADPDLFFEGGCVFLDLGRGMVSVTMHMSRINVKAGQVVKQGELLGLSGASGRVTGPHVHWAIKYRNVFDKDRGSDIWLDPMLLMKLKSEDLKAG